MKIDLNKIMNLVFLTLIALVLVMAMVSTCNAQWLGYENSGRTDTVKARFVVSSNHYEFSNLKVMSGYVVREIFQYVEDRIPCSDCDYSPNYMIVDYLTLKRKPIAGYTIWKYKIDDE